MKTQDKVMEYWWYVWKTKEVAKLNVQSGLPKHQTFWETLTLLLSLILWGEYATGRTILMVGDNTGSLQNTLELKGKGPLMAIAREVAWRKARHNWQFEVGHLPSEYNAAPDALSRQAGPVIKPWPTEALGNAMERMCPAIDMIWKFV